MATLGTPVYFVAGNKRLTIVKYTGPASYATGGDVVSAANLGLSVLDVLLLIPVNVGYELTLTHVFPATTGKIQFSYPTANLGAGTNTGAGTFTAPTIPSGATAVTSTAAQPALSGGGSQSAPGTEVQATANVSTVSAWLLAIGS